MWRFLKQLFNKSICLKYNKMISIIGAVSIPKYRRCNLNPFKITIPMLTVYSVNAFHKIEENEQHSEDDYYESDFPRSNTPDTVVLNDQSPIFINLEDEINTDLNPPSMKKPIINACKDALYSSSEFLNRILESLAVSFLEYKTSLNLLFELLEKYDSIQAYSYYNEKLEQKIIVTKTNIYESESNYIEMVSLSNHILKASKALADLSFLIGEENLSVKFSEIINYLKDNIEINDDEIKCLKRKIGEMEAILVNKTVETNTSSVNEI